MKDMCAECGADLRTAQGQPGERQQSSSASVAMVHSIPELHVSKEEALSLAKDDEERLLKHHKLVLVVDLDQTLIHTTMEAVSATMKDVHHFQLWNCGPQSLWYHTRIRPGCKAFLEEVSKYYELHIFTMGARMYAHTIASFLDPNQKYFSHRILSRDECFDRNLKTANLGSIFPCGDSMVCIIDDREDVWSNAPNLIHVKPYCYFRGTGDINTPPLYQKPTKGDNPSATSSPVSNTDAIKLSVEGSINTADETLADASGEANIETSPTTEISGKTNVETSPTTEIFDKTNVETSPTTEIFDKTTVETSLTTEISGKTTVETSPTTEGSEKATGESKKSCETSNTNGNKTLQQNNNSTELKNGTLQEVKNSDTDSKEKKETGNITKDKENSKISEGREVTVQEAKVEKVEENNDDDRDDYLLYLKENLIKVHKKFYEIYDHYKSKSTDNTCSVPDLKAVVPSIRKSTLAGVNIVFSGVFPTDMPPEKSRAWKVAKELGATVSPSMIARFKDNAGPVNATTHLVAAKPGTEKVRQARRMKGVKVVTVDWLWCCQERWEHIDERVFLLHSSKKPGRGSRSRSSTPASAFTDSEKDQEVAKKRREKNNPQARRLTRLSSDYNPLYSFSSEDLKCMDMEVEDIFNESSDESKSDDCSGDNSLGSVTLAPSSSSEDSLDPEEPHGWKRKRPPVESDDEERVKKVEKDDSSSSPGLSDEDRSEDEDKMAAAIDDLLTYSKVL
ncbi:RNA polymerase II subunit A C-terminal domain phosphatase-like [Antedon mediterranea]|uniref:RNA polymerase II subunit A C-terminal domain phosphatase-like n=1 Tax=Antedon mediterranea TaxID=105859 RepID=UPI003AF9B2C3